MILSDIRAVRRKVSSPPTAAYRPTTIWKYLQTNSHLAFTSDCSFTHSLSHSPLVRVGFAFFLMLLAVVSLKCSRPSVTLVIWPPGRPTLEDHN